MGNAQILSFVHYREFKGNILGLGNCGRERSKQLGIRYDPKRLKFSLGLLENRPKDFTLRFRESSLSPKSDNISIVFPTLQLPGIYNVVPFRQEKWKSKGVARNG